ncbi:hypothetical protein D3C72_717320 [compost metagenome]
MPAAFAVFVGAGADQQHAQQRGDARQRGEHADVKGIDDACVADEGRHPEPHGIGAEQDREVDAAEHPHLQVEETVAKAVLAAGGVGVVGAQFLFQQVSLVIIEPFGLAVVVRQGPEGQHTKQHAGYRFEEEQPLPAAQAASVIEMPHDPAGQRAAEHAGQRQADHEQGDDAAAAIGREPGGQVIQHPRQKARFGGAEQEAQNVELCGGSDEHGAGREQPPGDHDAGDPDLRPDFFQDQIARNLENDIADKKQTGAQAESRFAELQMLEHLQFGEADVDPVQI